MNQSIQYLNFPKAQYAELLEENKNELLREELENISFLYLEKDTSENRVLLRKLVNSVNNEHCILVSENTEMAYLAWKANVLAFMHFNKTEFSVSWNELTNRIKKYPPNSTIENEKLKINFKGGFDLIQLSQIYFCEGSGNYTYIYLEDGTKKCISYPLSKLENRLKKVEFLTRIGKSFIVNVNRVKKIKKDVLLFNGEKEIELKLGAIYIKRIKQNLLWY